MFDRFHISFCCLLLCDQVASLSGAGGSMNTSSTVNNTDGKGGGTGGAAGSGGRGHDCSKAGGGQGGGETSPGSPKGSRNDDKCHQGNSPRRPIVIDKALVIRLASQYTPCAGCSAAVKALLKRPIHELRLLNAVMCDDEVNNALR